MVPSVKSVMSSVVPAGTVIPLKTIEVQSAFPAMALSASVNVQSLEAVAVELVEFEALAVLEDSPELVVVLFDRSTRPVTGALPVGTAAPVPEGGKPNDGDDVGSASNENDLWLWWLRSATNHGAGAAATKPTPAPSRRVESIL